jgi:hypothetical protein
VAIVMPDRYARLSDDHASVLCGRQYATGHHCEVVLASIIEMAGRRHLVWDSDWELAGDRVRRTATTWERKTRGYAPTREGWWETVGEKAKPRKSFGFELQAECPQCHLLNIIDALRLDVHEVPLSE